MLAGKILVDKKTVRPPPSLLSRPTIAQAQLPRPFPQFGDISVSGGKSFHNSGAVKVQKPFSRGVPFFTSYDARPPAQKNWDFGILKTAAIFENFRAPFRLEAINAFHAPVFRSPNTAFGNADVAARSRLRQSSPGSARSVSD